jgi:hypothetical protein
MPNVLLAEAPLEIVLAFRESNQTLSPKRATLHSLATVETMNKVSLYAAKPIIPLLRMSKQEPSAFPTIAPLSRTTVDAVSKIVQNNPTIK